MSRTAPGTSRLASSFSASATRSNPPTIPLNFAVPNLLSISFLSLFWVVVVVVVVVVGDGGGGGGGAGARWGVSGEGINLDSGHDDEGILILGAMMWTTTTRGLRRG